MSANELEPAFSEIWSKLCKERLLALRTLIHKSRLDEEPKTIALEALDNLYLASNGISANNLYRLLIESVAPTQETLKAMNSEDRAERASANGTKQFLEQIYQFRSDLTKQFAKTYQFESLEEFEVLEAQLLGIIKQNQEIETGKPRTDFDNLISTLNFLYQKSDILTPLQKLIRLYTMYDSTTKFDTLGHPERASIIIDLQTIIDKMIKYMETNMTPKQHKKKIG
jgi:hypothetical protein